MAISDKNDKFGTNCQMIARYKQNSEFL